MGHRAPLEEAERRIATAARAAAKELPTGWGVAVFAFSYGPDGYLTWASNCNRRDAIAALREWLATNPENRAEDKV